MVKPQQIVVVLHGDVDVDGGHCHGDGSHESNSDGDCGDGDCNEMMSFTTVITQFASQREHQVCRGSREHD